MDTPNLDLQKFRRRKFKPIYHPSWRPVRKIADVTKKVVHLLDPASLSKLTGLLAAGPVRKRDILKDRGARFRKTYREALRQEIIEEQGSSGRNDPCMVGLSGCTFLKKIRWYPADLKLMLAAGCTREQAKQLLDESCDNQPDDSKLILLLKGARWEAEKRHFNEK